MGQGKQIVTTSLVVIHTDDPVHRLLDHGWMDVRTNNLPPYTYGIEMYCQDST